MGPRLYCKVELSRGGGLGNHMFAWARARLFAVTQNAQPLATRWGRLRLGPLLRGELDSRMYWDLFQPEPGSVQGFRKIWIEQNAQRIDETAVASLTTESSLKPRLIVFRGETGFFSPLLGHEALIRREIDKITRPQWLESVYSLPLPPIGLHVRCSDFKVTQNSQEMFTQGNVRTPLSWFVDSLKLVRERVGSDVGAFVVSDGKLSELESLLALPNVKLVRGGSAISDILLLSRARLLLATGGSSFGAWASYFGKMPTVTHPGQAFKYFGLNSTDSVYNSELDLVRPNPGFLENLQRIAPSLEMEIPAHRDTHAA